MLGAIAGVLTSDLVMYRLHVSGPSRQTRAGTRATMLAPTPTCCQNSSKPCCYVSCNSISVDEVEDT